MKLYVFFLSFVLAFFPSLSYAFAPIAIAGSTAGRVAIQNGAGAVIKKVAPQSLKKATHSALGVCAKNPSAFAFCGVLLSSIGKDGWKIEIENTTNNNDVDINIYKDNNGKCIYVYERYDSSLGRPINIASSPAEYFNKYVKPKFAGRGWVNVRYTGHFPTNYIELANKGTVNVQIYYAHDLVSPNVNISAYYKDSTSAQAGKFDCGDEKIYITDNEIDKYINNHISDDDITNIYNYDYSQHNRIEINNNGDSGDTINNKVKNDIDKNETEKNVSSNATEKMKNKRKGYDVDDINDENCEKNEKGEYDKCGDDRGKKDGEDSEEPKKDDTEEQPKKDDEKSDFCKMIPLICDLSLPSLPNVEVPTKNISLKNPVEFDKDYLSVRAECPPDVVRDIPLPGQSFQLRFELSPVCDFASTYLNPVIIFIAYIWGALSIGNAFKVG